MAEAAAVALRRSWLVVVYVLGVGVVAGGTQLLQAVGVLG